MELFLREERDDFLDLFDRFEERWARGAARTKSGPAMFCGNTSEEAAEPRVSGLLIGAR